MVTAKCWARNFESDDDKKAMDAIAGEMPG
jgi:hypothetical protein